MEAKHYIYVIYEREFIKTGEQIYKIGRTCQEPTDRFKGYPKGSKVILLRCVSDSLKAENLLKKELSDSPKYKHRPDIGAEYYQGHLGDFIHDVNEWLNWLDGISPTHISIFWRILRKLRLY